MKSGKNNRRKESLGTLAAQIRETERRIMRRQHRVHADTDILVKDLQHEMTSPATMLLIGGVGFIVGELTKGPSTVKSDKATKSADADITPLKKAVNFFSLAQSLFHALPLVWIMDTFYPPEGASKKTSSASAKKTTQNQSV